MRHDIELAYLGIAVPDPTALSEFFGETIGLAPGEPAGDGTLTWRNDDAAHRILVRPGPESDATFIGFEARRRSRLRRDGRPAAAGPASSSRWEPTRTSKRVECERLVRTTSPWGVSAELVLGLARRQRLRTHRR